MRKWQSKRIWTFDWYPRRTTWLVCRK